MSKLEEQTKAAEEQWMGSWKSGPGRTRWTEPPLQVGDPAPDFTLPDQTGEHRELSSFWADKPALILFWRHYGCGCGIDRNKRLKDEINYYSRANVVIIGQGEPERASAYAAKYELPPVPILCDPDEKAYRAFGLLEGLPSQILFDAPDQYLRLELQAGKTMVDERRDAGRPMVDNPWLLPGEFVIDTKGVVRLAYRYNFCEDFPDYRVLVAGIREAIGDFD